MTSIKVAVVGTGAQGAGVGADIIQAGFDVTFIEQWPAHVEAMREHGLRIELPDQTITTQVEAYHFCPVAELRQKFDVVFLVVKAYDSRWSTELIKPMLAGDGVVVGLQNGMSIDEVAAVVGEDRTVGAVIEIASNMFQPGVVVRQTPRSASWFAVGGVNEVSHRRASDVVDILQSAGTTEIAADIRSAKWMKLVANAGELVTTAILDMPMAGASALPGMREFMDRNCQEALAVALALGNRTVPIFGLTEVEGTPEEYAVELLEMVHSRWTLPDTLTTVLQDWRKGRRAEINEINGVVVREASQLGLEVPANRRTLELARRIEAGVLTADPSNLDLLLAP